MPTPHAVPCLSGEWSGDTRLYIWDMAWNAYKMCAFFLSIRAACRIECERVVDDGARVRHYHFFMLLVYKPHIRFIKVLFIKSYDLA